MDVTRIESELECHELAQRPEMEGEQKLLFIS